MSNFKLWVHTYTHTHTHLNPVQDGRVEDVHAGIDLVGDKHFRFLHELLYLSSVLLVYHHTILRGLLHTSHLQWSQQLALLSKLLMYVRKYIAHIMHSEQTKLLLKSTVLGTFRYIAAFACQI